MKPGVRLIPGIRMNPEVRMNPRERLNSGTLQEKISTLE